MPVTSPSGSSLKPYTNVRFAISLDFTRLLTLYPRHSSLVYNPAVSSRNFKIALIALLTATTFAQEPASAPTAKPSDKPQVRVNYLNVCAPAAADQQELETVLSRITPKPVFSADMEISRGRSTLNPSDLVVNTGQPTQLSTSVSSWVRIRHDFPESGPLTSAQYSFSVTDKHVSETLVVHFRDTKDVLQVSITDSVEADDSSQVARELTPADRIRIERFGKPSIVLARCPNNDQSALEPFFGHATMLMNAYRRAFDTSDTIPAELTRLAHRAATRPKKAASAPAKPQ